MNFRTTYILFGLVAAAFGLFGLALIFGPDKGTGDYVLPSAHPAEKAVASADVDRIEIARKEGTPEKIVFERDAETKAWAMTAPVKHRVDRSTVDRLVQQVLDAKIDKHVEITSDLKARELDPPNYSITLSQSGDKGKSWTVNLGRESATKEKLVYASSSDRPREAMGVQRMHVDNVFKSVKEFRSKHLLAETTADVTGINLRDGKHEPVILAHKSDNRWNFQQPSYGEAEYEGAAAAPGGPSSGGGVRGLLDAITSLLVEHKSDTDSDFLHDDASDEDLKKFGLDADNKEMLRIEVKHYAYGKDGVDKNKQVTDTLLLGTKADDKGEKVYARLENEKHVVKLAASKLEPIRKVLENPSSLRDRDLVKADRTVHPVDAINITDAAGELIKLRRLDGGKGPWRIYRGSSTTGQNVDEAVVNGLIDALSAKGAIKEFLPADTKEGNAVATVSLWVEGVAKEEKKEEKKDEKKDAEKKDDKKDGDKKDEKKDDKKEEKKEEKPDPNAEPKLKSERPTYKLTFGKRDRDKGLLYVKREMGDDSPAMVVAVSDALYDKVTAGPLTYLDRTLTTFDGDATKLIIDRDGETWELVPEKKDDKTTWKFVKPDAYAGRTANPITVQNILNDLKFLRAERLVSEKPSATVLDEQYGLSKPRAKATVTITRDGKPEDHVFSFGKDAENNLYAKQGKSDLVFTVRKDVLTALQSQLRDTAVFSFDPAKVKEMKLVGWFDFLKAPYTLDLEHVKENEWKVKSASSPDFKLDQGKAESFLLTLSGLRAEQFLPKTEAGTAHKFDTKEGGLEVSVTVDGEKDPLTLTIGGPTPDGKGFYAKSNKVEGDLFVVPKGQFEMVKTKDAENKKGTPFWFYKD